jgi:4-diphosphocytidyl-2-C-methyl-D-erythritol kinase
LICIFKENFAMILYPNAKINLGLNILEKRKDGFHNLESLFLPVGWSDVLEVLPSENDSGKDFMFVQTGIPLGLSGVENIIYKAYSLLKTDYDIDPVKVILHKQIPAGAGLGGGSSDAVSMVQLLNEIFNLKLSEETIFTYLEKIGSDCSFFYGNEPSFVRGRGEIIEPFSLDLSGYYLLIVVPDIHLSTMEAFSLITPRKPDFPLRQALQYPVNEWENIIKNDFEEVLFPKYPMLMEIKEKMYRTGALYSSMSGSGSAIYGIFKTEVNPINIFPGLLCWTEKL